MQGDISQDFKAAKCWEGGRREGGGERRAAPQKTPLTDVETYDLRADPYVSTSVVSEGRVCEILWQTVHSGDEAVHTPPLPDSPPQNLMLT